MSRTVQAVIDKFGFIPHLNRISDDHPVLVADTIFSALDSGSGTDLSVDGTTPVKFKHTVGAGEVHLLRRSNLMVLDQGQTPIKFAGITALTAGLKIEGIDTDGTTVLKDFTDGKPIKKNADWKRLAGVDNVVIDAAQSDARGVRWTLALIGGLPVFLPGQIFQVTVQDNLSDIDEFTWDVQGRKSTEDEFLSLLGL